MNEWGLLFFGSYFLGAIVTYGHGLAFWQREYPTLRRFSDVGMALFMGLTWPVSFLWLKGQTNHGLQWLPRAPGEHLPPSIFETLLCPSCGGRTWATDGEKANDSVCCTKCNNFFRYSTGGVIPTDLGDDEPDWSEPSDADLAWAQSTMPGKATGHTVGWRVWRVASDIPKTAIDSATTAELVQLSDTALIEKLAQIQNEIVGARGLPPYTLRSGNGAKWEPGQPIVGYFHDGMPRAHGAGIYAMKECPDECTTDVIGKVALWGSVVEHEHGYRARYAYPLELWCGDEARAKALEKHYGVTCHVGMPEGVTAMDCLERLQRIALRQMQQVQNRTLANAFGNGMSSQRQGSGLIGGLGL